MTVIEIENMLQALSEKTDSEGNALTAFTTLYREYSRFLASVVAAGLQRMGIYDEQVLNTVLNNTFYTLYENPRRFTFPNTATDDRPFKGWLSTVARNELTRLLDEYFGKSTPLTMVTADSSLESEEIDETFFASVNLKTMNDALNTLSERDREILWTLYLYYEEGKNTPSGVLDRLCKIHDTTRENIRQIKKRSEKKIIEYFAKHSQLKPLKDVR
ncbi:sigma-70 family RNA polymerase sigma factor [Niabella sp. CJ426]|uniref:sigma-70 family RNA polymerase sigma factor n=1 Tax=Niabella sp. CJ426 TaxID=3393740 RepID=UPI003D050AA6